MVISISIRFHQTIDWRRVASRRVASIRVDSFPSIHPTIDRSIDRSTDRGRHRVDIAHVGTRGADVDVDPFRRRFARAIDGRPRGRFDRSTDRESRHRGRSVDSRSIESIDRCVDRELDRSTRWTRSIAKRRIASRRSTSRRTSIDRNARGARVDVDVGDKERVFTARFLCSLVERAVV